MCWTDEKKPRILIGMTQTIFRTADKLPLPRLSLELYEAGSGPPLLFLHPENGLRFEAPWAEDLAAHFRLIAPSHPGFGASELPRWMATVDDLAYTYLDLLKALELKDVIVVGVGFGGWVAAEIAVRSTERISGLVLANPVGIKVSDRETRDIVDIFATAQPELLRLSYHDPANGQVDASAMTEGEALTLFRNREAIALFAWSPYMHSPRLKYHLHRIDVPTLVLWGESDQLVSQSYGRAFAAAIPGARFETVPAAGHFPHVEAPRLFAERILAFSNTKRAAKGSES
jgi:pimeloyl-ACP methyl ester carboxylesterase